MITTVEELISALAKYPKNMKVYSNQMDRAGETSFVSRW